MSNRGGKILKNIIIPAGIGIILTVVGWYVQSPRKNVRRFLENSRIDGIKSRPKDICGVCGAKMVKRRSLNGPHQGKFVMVCSRWPDCRKVDWSNPTDT